MAQLLRVEEKDGEHYTELRKAELLLSGNLGKRKS